MSFAEEILQALVERDVREKAWEGMIEHQRKLSTQMLLMRDRNRSLLKASSGSSGTGAATGESAVRAAYVASLESQLSTLRDELTGLYKTQAQNAQRLIHLTETLREAEDRSRSDTDHLRDLQTAVDKLTRKAEEARTLRKEKEKNIEHLNDELATLQLEYTQLEHRNNDLQRDNRELVQRWLERVQGDATKLNEANAIIEVSQQMRATREDEVPLQSTKRSSPMPSPKLSALDE